MLNDTDSVGQGSFVPATLPSILALTSDHLTLAQAAHDFPAGLRF